MDTELLALVAETARRDSRIIDPNDLLFLAEIPALPRRPPRTTSLRRGFWVANHWVARLCGSEDRAACDNSQSLIARRQKSSAQKERGACYEPLRLLATP